MSVLLSRYYSMNLYFFHSLSDIMNRNYGNTSDVAAAHIVPYRVGNIFVTEKTQLKPEFLQKKNLNQTLSYSIQVLIGGG